VGSTDEWTDLRHRYRPLLDQVLGVPAYRDPVNIDAPPNFIYVYALEVKAMLVEVAQARSLAELGASIYCQSVEAFEKGAGGRECYEILSEHIWEILQDPRIREMDG
jgi:hypothetical protein